MLAHEKATYSVDHDVRNYMDSIFNGPVLSIMGLKTNGVLCQLLLVVEI